MLEEFDRIAVIAHDLGSANHIFSWVGSGDIPREKLSFSLRGPALRTAKNLSFLRDANLSEDISSESADLVLSGTGWASDFEIRSMMKHSGAGLQVFAVIDHWVNYLSRFQYRGSVFVPDQIWVTDQIAESIAVTTFPSVPVKLVRNRYLESQVDEVKSYSKQAAEDAIFYLMEPIRDDWGAGDLPGERIAFDYFMGNRAKLNLNNLPIRIRPHPSDPKGKYEDWLAEYPEDDIAIRYEGSLAKMIAEASVVIGCHTYAMVVAAKAGKKVVCSIPPGLTNNLLPQDEILNLADLE